MNTAQRHFTLRPFRPAWWLPGGHGQTIGGRALRRMTGASWVRERFTTPDGDFLDVDFSEPLSGESRDSAPIVVLLHGLEGSSESGYMAEAARLCGGQGLRAAALNFRGRSGSPNRRPRAYHAGETGDLGFILSVLHERAPSAPLAAIGFSLGGNVLLKYLGETGAEGSPRLAAAAAISVPFDLAAATARMERGMGLLYTRFFLRSLRDGVRAKAEDGPLPYDPATALKARTLRDFDEAVTAPLHGFMSASDYYERSSSLRYLAAIRVPTLLLQAKDDPFHPVSAEETGTVRDNPWLQAGFVERGGHVGFVGGPTPLLPFFWAEAEAVRFVATYLRAGHRGGEPDRGRLSADRKTEIAR
ncbi:MAG: alpha/beta fold hydrolase [Gemmatimonadales bacterium]